MCALLVTGSPSPRAAVDGGVRASMTLTDSVGVSTTTESVSVRRKPVAIDGVVPRGTREGAPGA